MKMIKRAEFDTEINRSGLVVVDIGAEWCPGCRMLKPILQKVAKEMSHIQIVEIDADDVEMRDILLAYKVSALPTLLYFVSGEFKEKTVGLMRETAFTEKLNGLSSMEG